MSINDRFSSFVMVVCDEQQGDQQKTPHTKAGFAPHDSSDQILVFFLSNGTD